jgi:hypothetical protein
MRLHDEKGITELNINFPHSIKYTAELYQTRGLVSVNLTTLL